MPTIYTSPTLTLTNSAVYPFSMFMTSISVSQKNSDSYTATPHKLQGLWSLEGGMGTAVDKTVVGKTKVL
jgi:hypothetical protein